MCLLLVQVCDAMCLRYYVTSFEAAMEYVYAESV